MARGLFRRLAWTNIRKNRKIYYPYILTAVGCVLMFYIIFSLSIDGDVKRFNSGANVQIFLRFGTIIMGLFSLGIIFTANSFMMKNRTTELGLYNVLGMGKNHIIKVIAWENAMVCAISTVIGIALGAVFSKLAQLVLLKFIKLNAEYSFKIDPLAVLITAGCFLVIFILMYIKNVVAIFRQKTIELLYTGKKGEKVPKGNLLLGLLGTLVLCAGYFTAVATKDAFKAFSTFFPAVVMVIVGTFMVFISASVALLSLMKKSKTYYYRTGPFVSTSAMMFRMKKHGSGLAQICILSTMVLVMISSTSCLYFGGVAAAEKSMPREITVRFDGKYAENAKDMGRGDLDDIRACGAKFFVAADSVLEEKGYGAEEKVEVIGANVRNKDFNLPASSQYSETLLLTRDEFQKMTGKTVNLNNNQIRIYSPRENFDDSFKAGDRTYDVIVDKDMDTFGAIVVPEDEDMEYIMENAASGTEIVYYYMFNPTKQGSPLKEEEAITLAKAMESSTPSKIVGEYEKDFFPHFETALVTKVCRSEMLQVYTDLYGGLFFLGILLSILFMGTTVMIMYYKQVTEGYDDKQRFDVLQKVGMSRGEIKKCIRHQVLVVFFAPLLVAGVHVAFAFPILRIMLAALGVTDTLYLIVTFLVAFAVFAAFYVLMYALTSREYYRIVAPEGDGGSSGARSRAY